jgi:NAD+ synthase (glutamine-hydrolysing)
MKIALAQINTTVGAIPENGRRMAEWIDRAAGLGADLVVFPELALTGYPPKDLLDHRSFVAANLEELERLAEATAGEGRPGAIVGYVDRREEDAGKTIYNAAAVIDGGGSFRGISSRCCRRMTCSTRRGISSRRGG